MTTEKEMKIAIKTPVRESGELMYNLSDYDKNIVIDLEKKSRDIQKIKNNTCFLRLSVIKRLSKAQFLLPKGLHLKVIDGYRPIRAQKTIYRYVLSMTKKKHPHMSKKGIERVVNKWVANPYRIIPPHSTGGTVDITVVDSKGKELDMGTRVNSMDRKSSTKSKSISKIAKKNRHILIKVMSKAGFVNNPREWWHWSYGDWRWAYKNKTSAIYKAF